VIRPQALIASYRDAWQEAGSGQWFLIAGFVFASRILAFNVAFPLYAKEQGFDSSQIGLLLAAVAISLFVFGVPVTMLGARGRSRRALITGPLIAACGVLLILIAPGGVLAPALVGCLLAGMASNVFWILGDPILAGAVPARNRSHVFALKFALLTMGFAMGGLLGGWIPSILEAAGVSTKNALAGALVVVMALDMVQSLCYRKMPIGAPRMRAASAAPAPEAPRFTGLAMWGILLLLLVPEMGMATGFNSIRPYLSLFFDEEFGMSAGATGTAISLMQLAGGVGALLIPSMAVRFGASRTMALLRFIGGASIAFALGAAALPVVLMLFFVHYSIVDGTGATFVNDVMSRMPTSQRTIYSAVAAAVWSVFSAIAASTSGYLQDLTGGFGAAFGVGVIAYFISAAWLLLVLPRMPSLFAKTEATPGLLIANQEGPRLVPGVTGNGRD
jgi:MFS family permease